MKTTFRLARPQNQVSTVIYLDINHRNQRTRFYTEVSILPKYWHQDTQKTKGNRSEYENDLSLKGAHENINAKLSQYKIDVNNYIRTCEVKGENITSKGLQSYLNGLYKVEQSNEEKTPFLTEYMENTYIPKLKSGEITYLKNNQRLKFRPSTIKVKHQSLNAFNEYEKKNGKIRFDDIDMKFYHKFVSWHEKRKLKINYIGKLVKELKVILRQAYKEGQHSNKIADNKDFATFKEDVPAIYLTQKELNSLQALKLSERAALHRDMFLVGCYTALRFSDYSRLTADHIKERDGSKQIEIITQKTSEPVYVPIHPNILPILTNPDFFDRGIVYAHHFNESIKDICESAKITEMIEVIRIIGGLTKIKNVPKCKLVTSHTARRTGATLMYLAGIPSLAIMQFTSHKTESAFLKYIRETKKETARRLASHEFFRPSLSVVK